MRAMVFAAGLGTRLRPLTDSRPKALVEVNGRPLLEITLTRLKESGVDAAIVNVHHFADMVVDFLRARDNFGMRIEVSREDVLLDTGGGLKKAAPFFLSDPERLEEPFIVHNVDVISTIDFDRMVQHHLERRALATLAVQDRPTSRPLLFDQDLQLCGRITPAGDELVRPCPFIQRLAFSGIHVISPRLLTMFVEDGAFSIIPVYLRLAGLAERIVAFRADAYEWGDWGDISQRPQLHF